MLGSQIRPAGEMLKGLWLKHVWPVIIEQVKKLR
jgi:hypothetical protein